jgi:uncharacterized membrane protein YfcA
MPAFVDLDFFGLLFRFAAVFFAGLVHGTLGLGFPMIATPLLALHTDVLTAMLLVLLPTLTVNVISIAAGGRWRSSLGRYWPLAFYGALGSMAGTRLLILTDPAPYRLLLAAVILFYLNVHRLGFRMDWVRRRPALAFAVFGFAGGLLAGTVNVMVPALIVFALESGLAPTATVQLFNFCFLAGKLSQAVVFGGAGLLTREVLFSSLPLVGIVAAALTAGMFLRRRIEAESYRRWMRRVLGVIAALLVVQFFRG